jgi:hypothetical protein
MPTTFPTQPHLGDLSRRSGLFPSWRRRLAPAASLVTHPLIWAFAVWLSLVTRTAPLAHPALYLPDSLLQDLPLAGALAGHGCTSMHFGENQLSPGSISISPLSTRHPPVLQHWWVRASTRSHPRFTLRMDSSPGFGSGAGNACSVGGGAPRDALFRLAFAPAPRLYRRLTCSSRSRRGDRRAAAINSSDHSTKGTPSGSHAVANHPAGHALRLLVGAGFQSLFHPPLGVLFTFPSRYSFPIGGQAVLRLGGWSPRLPTGFRVSRGTQAHSLEPPADASRTGLSPAAALFPTSFRCVCRSSPLPSQEGGCRLQPRQDHPVRRPGRFGLIPFRSPLLRESRLIPLPRGTEMFQFPRFPSAGYLIPQRIRACDSAWVAPFGSGWLFARLQLPIHVSPLSAPFFGSWPLGILPTPCSAWQFLLRPPGP